MDFPVSWAIKLRWDTFWEDVLIKWKPSNSIQQQALTCRKSNSSLPWITLSLRSVTLRKRKGCQRSTADNETRTDISASDLADLSNWHFQWSGDTSFPMKKDRRETGWQQQRQDSQILWVSAGVRSDKVHLMHLIPTSRIIQSFSYTHRQDTAISSAVRSK